MLKKLKIKKSKNIIETKSKKFKENKKKEFGRKKVQFKS